MMTQPGPTDAMTMTSVIIKDNGRGVEGDVFPFTAANGAETISMLNIDCDASDDDYELTNFCLRV